MPLVGRVIFGLVTFSKHTQLSKECCDFTNRIGAVLRAGGCFCQQFWEKLKLDHDVVPYIEENLDPAF